MSNVHIFDSEALVAKSVAKYVKDLIERKNQQNKTTVLCLPTGSTPIPVYKELIRMNEEEGLSFKNVVSFNLDEYYPMEKSHDQSYHYYMEETFFSKVKDFKPENINIPDGELPREKYHEYCEEFERKIDLYQGFDVALVGIGRTGHVGFNEPGSMRDDMTRLVVLHNQTRKDNSRFFSSLQNVPKFAITQGMGTILKKSKKIILIATGFHKSKIMLRTLEGTFNSEKEMSLCPATFLRDHPNCHFYLDRPAAYRLKNVRFPWLTCNPVIFDWSPPDMKKRAVVWLSQEVGKPILNLTEEDFCNNGLSSLFYLSTEGSGNEQQQLGRIQSLCKKTFNEVLSCIHRDQTNDLLPDLRKERVLVFSPHPDDDVMSIGGTILTLFSTRNEGMVEHEGMAKLLDNFRICYMTSGSRGVSNDDIKDHLRFTKLSISDLGMLDEKGSSSKRLDEILKNVVARRSKDLIPDDSKVVQRLKTNVRKSESMNAIEKLLGCPTSLYEMKCDDDEEEDEGEVKTEDKKKFSCDLQFLDLPFYQTGKNKKLPSSEEDVGYVTKVLEDFQPDHIFVCNDLEDVHGTHGICYHILREALKLYESKKKEGRRRVKRVFLYKGLWQEFDLSEVNLFVTLDEHIMNQKIAAIFKHQSQQNKPMFPGDDKREFFVRAKERNETTASQLTKLGLPAYFAMESLRVVEDLSKK